MLWYMRWGRGRGALVHGMGIGMTCNNRTLVIHRVNSVMNEGDTFLIKCLRYIE